MATTKLSTTIAGIVAGATGATGPTGPTGATGATGASGATTQISNGTSNLNIPSSGGVIYANTAGVNAVTIDASQNVGIGVTPTYKLDVFGSTARIYNDSATLLLQRPSNSRSAQVLVNNANGGIKYYAGNNGSGENGTVAHEFTSDAPSTGTVLARINSFGIGLGANTPSSGTGIMFPATQSASGDPNTLDDYEEGTYTPSVTGSTSGGPFTFGTQSGYYTKIGREVKVSMFMSHNSTISLGGAYKISLPFTVADYAGGGFVTYFANWIGQSPRIFQIEASTTYGYLRSFSTTEMVDMQSGHVQNNTSYMLTIIYKTT